MSARPRLLVIGALPRSDSPVGGTQVSLSELVARLRQRDRFELDLIDTSRRATDRSRLARVADDAVAFATTLVELARRAGECDAVLFNASAGAVLSAGPVIALACRTLEKPLAVRVFGGNLDLVLARASRWRRALFERDVMAAELVLLQTKALCAQFAHRGNTRWLPTTRDMPRPRDIERAQCRRFLFLSQLRPEKGFAEAIRALERTPGGCTLTIAGPLMATTDLRELERSPRARYIGPIAPRAVARVLAEHDALVFPTYHEGEGMPGIVIEAMQCGRPVIATRWRALPELVEDGLSGLLVEPREVEPLAEAMIALASDAALYRRLAERALERGDEFRGPRWHEQLEGWLAELCSRGPRAASGSHTRRASARPVARSR